MDRMALKGQNKFGGNSIAVNFSINIRVKEIYFQMLKFSKVLLCLCTLAVEKNFSKTQECQKWGN